MNPEQLQAFAHRAATSRRLLLEAIQKAYADGTSLRVIAAATGVSHEQVRRICSKDLNLPDQLDSPNP